MISLLCAVGLRRVFPQATRWHGTGREVLGQFGVLTLAALLGVLLGEAWHFHPRSGAPVSGNATVVVGLVLAVGVVLCLIVALRSAGHTFSRRDGGEPLELPMNIPPTGLVYAAEALLALLGLHIYLCEPLLFRLGLIERYWMLIVMIGAFAGAGLGHFFQRRGLDVLAEPLRRTAEWLPVIVMLGFWVIDTDQPRNPLSLAKASPALWFLMAVFYGLLARGRRAVAMSGLAIFTGSVGLWVMLDRGGFTFAAHPQLWLIPPGLALLVAERIDRGRLDDAQRAGLRYLALSMIYVSSTTEFLRGVGESTWLPLVLVALCVIGVLVGVTLRIRGYVYLGVAFLLVVIARMIGYAAFEQGRMWLFWTCCIGLGAGIIALFAVFERRRDEIADALGRFRRWEP